VITEHLAIADERRDALAAVPWGLCEARRVLGTAVRLCSDYFTRSATI
jgi:hypothetical protein